MLPKFQPMPLGRLPEPFCHPDWFFEIKWDGFRALAYIEDGQCRLISRNGNRFKSFSALNLALPLECHAKSAVLDGELVCLDDDGAPRFEDLLFHRGEPGFQAFDCMWCEGEDLRYLPLSDRKHRLRSVVPRNGERLLYSDHVESTGGELFKLACRRDLEGIVAKRKFNPYLPDRESSWFKIRNRNYSQWIGREQLFERERGINPDLHGWEVCAEICAEVNDVYAEAWEAH